MKLPPWCIFEAKIKTIKWPVECKASEIIKDFEIKDKLGRVSNRWGWRDGEVLLPE